MSMTADDNKYHNYVESNLRVLNRGARRVGFTTRRPPRVATKTW